MAIAQEISGAARQAAVGSLGEMARSPIVRAAVRYWWITVPIGFAAWRSWQKRRAQGGANPLYVLMDVSPLIAAVGTVVMINEALRSAEARQQAAAAARPVAAARPAPAAQPVRDADFTLAPEN